MDSQAQKKGNRQAKEEARQAANRSWNHAGAATETRQRVRAEGRILEASIAKREAKARADARPRKVRRTASMVASFNAHRTAIGYLPRHDFGLHGEAKKAVRRERQEALREMERLARLLAHSSIAD